MAVSCDDQEHEELNQRIERAFRAHYDDMVEALTVCTRKVARILYQNEKIPIETMREASEDTWSKYRRSIAVVDAIDVYIKTWKSSSKSLEVLAILEKHPPLDGVIARIRKHMQHSSAASSVEETNEEGTEETNSNEGTTSSNEGCTPKLKRSRYRLPSKISGQYTDLKWRFGKLKRTVKSLILDSPEEGLFSTLKDQLLQMYSEDLNTCSIIHEAADTTELLDNIVLPRCTVTNYCLLKILAIDLKIPKILDEIRIFSKSEGNLKRSLLKGEFADAVNTEISRHQSNTNLPLTEITLKVNMMESEATLKEFRSLIEEIFPLLYQYIDLEVTKEGCVCFVCYAPKYLEDVLIKMAMDQIEVAINRRVVYLSVGRKSIIDSTSQQVFTTKYLLTEESTSSLSLPSPPHEEVTVSQPKEQVTASPNWGVLLDVSGSMQSAYATDSKRDVSVQRTHTLFTTVANIVGKEVANHKRYQSIFACGFGIQEPAPVCNLIPLFELLRDLRLSQSQPQDLVRLARQHEAPHAERWITKHLTEKEASVLNYLLRKDESLIPRLIEKLPQDSIAVRGFGAILSFVESLPVIGGAAEAQETQMVTTSEAYTYAQDIMRTAFLNSFNKPIKSSSVIHVSKVMCELLETEQASASSSSESLRDYVQELVDYIKPYIYGGTPMCMAMNEAVRIFKQADPDMEKVLFVLSDGESGDGDPCPIAQELHALGVCIVTCYLTSDRLDNPKHLLYHANPDWRDGRLALFKMSSTMKNTHTPISYLIDAGWQLPASGESRLFVQANSMEIVNEFCETVVKHLTKGCDALVDVLAKVPLATYINQYNADFIPKKEQYGGTCYANAIAATFHLAMHRIVGREGGIPDFYTIRERIIHEYGQHGATADRVLEKVCPEYRLHFRKVEETGARQAINQRRPVVATYGLYAEEWDNFSRFFRNAKKGILKRADVQTSGPTTKPEGHAVVLIRCDPDCLTFMNSWGTEFADDGFFRVEDQSVLNDMEFFDVYWTLDDLTSGEKNAYKIEGTRKAKEVLEEFPSLKDVIYKCPKCKCDSKVVEYYGNLLEAECPKCHKSFEPTKILQSTLYSHNMEH